MCEDNRFANAVMDSDDQSTLAALVSVLILINIKIIIHHINRYFCSFIIDSIIEYNSNL